MTRKQSLLLAAAATAWLALPGCKSDAPAASSSAQPSAADTAPPAAAATAGKEVQTPSGLRYTDNVVGTGKEAAKGMTAVVEYRGTLTDGTQFDTSIGKKPFEFAIGTGGVIKGWDEGVVGMKIGGKRSLKIPAVLGYGEKGSPPNIPPNATLLFDIELKDLK